MRGCNATRQNRYEDDVTLQSDTFKKKFCKEKKCIFHTWNHTPTKDLLSPSHFLSISLFHQKRDNKTRLFIQFEILGVKAACIKNTNREEESQEDLEFVSPLIKWMRNINAERVKVSKSISGKKTEIHKHFKWSNILKLGLKYKLPSYAYEMRRFSEKGGGEPLPSSVFLRRRRAVFISTRAPTGWIHV